MSVFPEPPELLERGCEPRDFSFRSLSQANGGQGEWLPVSFPSSPKMTMQSWHAFQVHKVPGLPLREEEQPSAASHERCSKATWECPLVTKFTATTQSLSFLSCSKTPSSLLLPELTLQWHQSISSIAPCWLTAGTGSPVSG